MVGVGPSNRPHFLAIFLIYTLFLTYDGLVSAEESASEELATPDYTIYHRL